MANKDFKIKNGLDMSSPLPVAMGGTGQTSTTNSLNSMLPSQSGNANKVLSTDGTNTSFITLPVAYQRGGTASRPASPTAGDLYYNTDYNYFESYTTNGWFPIAAAPGIPTGVTATNQGTSRAYNNGQMSVAFTPASSGGAPTSFILTPTPATSPTTFTSGTSPIVVTGLSSSTQYTHTVVSTSPYGTSAASSASTAVTATTVPQAPSLVATGLSETTASIAITAGSTGGSAITGYSITSNPATTTQTTSSSPYTFTGLTTGTAYTFTAYASNALGNSATSSASNSITPAASGDWESISTQTITNSSATAGSNVSNTISFNNIPSTYKHLRLQCITKDTWSATGFGENYMFFNNVTTGNPYANHWTAMSSTSSSQFNTLNRNDGIFFGVQPRNENTNAFGTATVEIYDYTNTNKAKVIKGIAGAEWGASSSVQFLSGMSSNTATIDSIQIWPNGTGFQYRSTFALYGMKG